MSSVGFRAAPQKLTISAVRTLIEQLTFDDKEVLYDDIQRETKIMKCIFIQRGKDTMYIRAANKKQAIIKLSKSPTFRNSFSKLEGGNRIYYDFHDTRYINNALCDICRFCGRWSTYVEGNVPHTHDIESDNDWELVASNSINIIEEIKMA